MKIWIGYEPRETNAYLVAVASIRKFWPDAPVSPISLRDMRRRGIYTRPMTVAGGVMFDVVSGAPMSTEFAVSRFLVPHLTGSGPALFMDCDMLVRADLRELFALADPSKAVMCVQHEHVPDAATKMDGQIQTAYRRKNWSSVMLFPECSNAGARWLDPGVVNAIPGRDLHGFTWLDSSEIGALDPAWNYLAGHTTGVRDPKIVHFTDGIPSMPGYETAEFADEWFGALEKALARL